MWVCFHFNLYTASSVALCLIKSNMRLAPAYFHVDFVSLRAYVIERETEVIKFQFTCRSEQNSVAVQSGTRSTFHSIRASGTSEL